MIEHNCIIGQSGGPTAAINATLAGILDGIRGTNKYNFIYGMINGIEGVLNNNIVNFNYYISIDQSLKDLCSTPAMFLGSCRYKLTDQEVKTTEYEKITSILLSYNVRDVYYIGGNDSMDTILKLDNYCKDKNICINFFGIPKTIDNDMFGSDHTPGFGSAAKFVATSILEVFYDAHIYNTESITIVEIMGRNSGWLTASAALARVCDENSVDLIYLPEISFSLNKLFSDVMNIFKKKKNIIIAVSEGIRDKDNKLFCERFEYANKDSFGHIMYSGVSKILEKELKDKFGCKVRGIELSVLQRSASHIVSANDIKEAYLLGKKAIEMGCSANSGEMIGIKRLCNNPYSVDYEFVSLKSVANHEKKIPMNWIDDAGNNIKEELYNYLFPLIQGEVDINYNKGLPVFSSLIY